MASVKVTDLPLQIPPYRKMTKKVLKSLKGWNGKNIPLSNGLGAPYKTLWFYLLTLFISNLNFSLLFIQRAIGVCGVNGQHAQ